MDSVTDEDRLGSTALEEGERLVLVVIFQAK